MPIQARRQSGAMNGATQGMRLRANDASPLTKAPLTTKAALTKVRVSPAPGSVSRATPVTPVTPGLHPSPPSKPSPVVPVQRRSSTPVRQRGSPPSAHPQRQQQQQQALETPVRPVTGSSPVVVMTPSSAEQSGNRLHDQARETRERMERRRKEGASPLSAVSGLSPFTPRRWSNPRMGNPSVAGMDRVESLYQDAIQRNAKLTMARLAEEKNPRDCTFTPEISKRGSSRDRGAKREHGGDGGENVDASLACFHALYADAKRRRAKIEALTGAHLKEVAGPGSPVITARGRQLTREPLDVRLKENADRWTRRWQELECRRVEQEREGCTFMPNFSVGRSASAPRMRSRRDGDGGGGGRSRSPRGIVAFVERSGRFQVAREKKMEQLKREAKDRERAEATFQPKVTAWETKGGGGSPEGGVGGSSDVFERLLRAAEDQEVHKAALKKEFLKNELEEFHRFQVPG